MVEVQEEESLAKRLVERNLVVPTQDNQEEYYNQVSIIRGLSTTNSMERIKLKLEGYTFDYFKKSWVKSRKPIMNTTGVGNFMTVLESIGDQVNFSYYESKDIPKLALMFFSDNYPNFLVYSKEFELDPKDFNVIKSILQFWGMSVLNNAKNAGHRNVVRGTLSEGILARALGTQEQKPSKKGLFSFLRRDKGGKN
jgi:hypothetical protein